jgi:iron complex outermembrane recepter protein
VVRVSCVDVSKKNVIGAVCLVTVSALLSADLVTEACAQSLNLPPVTVDAPKQRQVQSSFTPQRVQTTRSARRITSAGRGVQAAPAATATSQNKGAVERGNGPINGYVAGRSLAGTKTDTPLLETPQAISVVGRDQIADQGSQSLVEALRYTAGVSVNTNPNDTRFDSILIRGFQPVLYLDGMQLPYGTQLFGRPMLDPFMLERVEVLKGPSSSLYGQVAPGGLINLVSLLPPSTPTHMVEFLADSFGRAQIGFDVGGPTDPKGDLLYRITGVVHDGGTQIDDVNDFRGVISPSFTWKPDLDTTLTVLGSFQRDVTGVEIQFLPAQGTLLPNPNGVVPISKFIGEPGYNQYNRTQYWAGYEFEHHADDTWTLRQNLRYTAVDTEVKAVISTGLQANQQTLNRSAFDVPENATAFTMDNQAEARFNTGPLSHVALFGLDYRHSTSEFSQYFGAAPSINLFNTVYGAPITPPPLISHTGQSQDQLGLYTQDQIALGGWCLTLSGRHDWVETETFNYIAATRQNQDDEAFSGRAGLNYVFASGVSPYVAYAKSFQPTLGVSPTGTPFQPTTGEQYEAGVKYQPVGTNLMFTAALFDITQQNVLTPALSAIPGQQVQTGEARSRGGDLEATASLTSGFKFVASYTYTDTDVTKTNTPSQLGKHLITVPLNQAALWGDYTFQNGRLTGFGFGAGVHYIGDSYGDAANTILIPDYTLFDMAVHYDLANLDPKLRGAKIALNVNNLFNKAYVSTCASLSQCYYGTGRVITGSLRYSW